MLTCKQLTELVTDFVEGRLSVPDRLRFHIHLGMCGPCRAYLRQMKATVVALGQLPDEVEIPKTIRDELRRRFANWHADRAATRGPDKPEPA